MFGGGSPYNAHMFDFPAPSVISSFCSRRYRTSHTYVILSHTLCEVSHTRECVRVLYCVLPYHGPLLAFLPSSLCDSLRVVKICKD